MDKCRGFSVEAVQTIGLFVNKGVVLRDELPADFRRIDGGRAVGSHDDGAVSLSVSVWKEFVAVPTVRMWRRCGECVREGHGGR